MRKLCIGKWGIGLILIGLIGLTSCIGSPTSDQSVTVTLTDNAIQSSLTAFNVNKSYQFVVTNKGQVMHEFMIMPPPSSTRNMSPDELNKVALASIPSLEPGQTKNLNFTFTHDNSMKYSTGMDMRGFEFASHLPGQYEKGMKLTISIIPGQ